MPIGARDKAKAASAARLPSRVRGQRNRQIPQGTQQEQQHL